MAKKKKGSRGAFGKGAPPGSSKDPGSQLQPDSRVKSGAFCFKSSLGVPFLVISDGQLIADVPTPTSGELAELLAMASGMVKQWDLRGAVVLADFEGEFTGIEGELVSAAFQRTWAVDPKGLRQMPCKGASSDMGLLLDLRSSDGIALVRRLMESETISKVIWGCDGDVTSLRYTPISAPLGINSTQVVDVQLAFSSSKQRLAMAAMLERLPPEYIAGLPGKAEIDFNTPHATNSRALQLPLGTKEATYAVDDLHRLDAILRSQKHKSGSYRPAEELTSVGVSLVLHNLAGASSVKLQQFERMLAKKTGTERQALAVRIKRHLIALRRCCPKEGCSTDYAVLEKEAEDILAEASVTIPEDLSFSGASEATASLGDAFEPVERKGKVRKKTEEEVWPTLSSEHQTSRDEAKIHLRGQKRKVKVLGGLTKGRKVVQGFSKGVVNKKRRKMMNLPAASGSQ